MYHSGTVVDYFIQLLYPQKGPGLNMSRRHVQNMAKHVVQLMIEDGKTW